MLFWSLLLWGICVSFCIALNGVLWISFGRSSLLLLSRIFMRHFSRFASHHGCFVSRGSLWIFSCLFFYVSVCSFLYGFAGIMGLCVAIFFLLCDHISLVIWEPSNLGLACAAQKNLSKTKTICMKDQRQLGPQISSINSTDVPRISVCHIGTMK